MAYQFNPLTGNFDIVNPQLTGSEIKTLYEDEGNTNAFTDAEKSKLAALDSDGYVQLTGNQTIKGIKTFAEKLLLPNCTFINGVAHFEQTTKPTQRVFLVNDVVTTESLVIGDKWNKTNDGTKWFWNGTYWLSSTLYVHVIFSVSGSGTTAGVKSSVANIPTNMGLFVEKVKCYINHTAGSGVNASNYYQLQGLLLNTGGGSVSIPSVLFIQQAPFNLKYEEISPNFYVNNPSGVNSIHSFGYLVTHVGSPTGGHFSLMEFNYRFSI